MLAFLAESFFGDSFGATTSGLAGEGGLTGAVLTSGY